MPRERTDRAGEMEAFATVAREGGDLAACEAMAKSTLARAETWIYLHQLGAFLAPELADSWRQVRTR